MAPLPSFTSQTLVTPRMESGDCAPCSGAPETRAEFLEKNGVDSDFHSTKLAKRHSADAKNDDDSPLYLDFNATTPMAFQVKTAIVKAMDEGWGNPSSSYAFGLAAKAMVTDAREKVATMINAASADHVIFTSGGTEADNWVIHSVMSYFRLNERRYRVVGDGDGGNVKPHVITTNFEHDAVRLPLEEMQRLGRLEVSFLPPVHGQVSPAAVVAALKANTCLVTIMLANNETGTIQPLADIVKAVKECSGSAASRGRLFFHTDAAQGVGKICVDVEALGVDFLTLVGHKFYGPRIGALYVRRPSRVNLLEEAGEDASGTPLFPMYRGGGQEWAFRPGTENTPMIAGLGAASELVSRHLGRDYSHMSSLVKLLETHLEWEFNQSGQIIVFNSKFVRDDGARVPRLPNTCNVSFRPPDGVFKPVSGRELLFRSGIAASVGAACHGHSSTPSSVLLAFGVDPADAITAIRISVGRSTTLNEVVRAVALLKRAYDELYGVDRG